MTRLDTLNEVMDIIDSVCCSHGCSRQNGKNGYTVVREAVKELIKQESYEEGN